MRGSSLTAKGARDDRSNEISLIHDADLFGSSKRFSRTISLESRLIKNNFHRSGRSSLKPFAAASVEQRNDEDRAT
jgi:hypothetical protein